MEKKTKKNEKAKSDPCTKTGDCKTLVIEGTSYVTRLNKKFENRKNWQAPDPRMVYSFIPGTILSIFVKAGQKVKAGEPLVILEAMKMRNVVSMPMDGTIEKINVKSGDKIPKGQLIVKIK